MPKLKIDVTVDQPGPSDERAANSPDRLDWDAQGDLPAPCHAPESVDRPAASSASS